MTRQEVWLRARLNGDILVAMPYSSCFDAQEYADDRLIEYDKRFPAVVEKKAVTLDKVESVLESMRSRSFSMHETAKVIMELLKEGER